MEGRACSAFVTSAAGSDGEQLGCTAEPLDIVHRTMRHTNNWKTLREHSRRVCACVSPQHVRQHCVTGELDNILRRLLRFKAKVLHISVKPSENN